MKTIKYIDITFALFFLVTFLLNYIFRGKSDMIETTFLFALLGLIPFGLFQVVFAIFGYVSTKRKYWLFYFIPLILFIIIAIFCYHSENNLGMHNITSTLLPVLVGLVILCVLSHTALFHYFSKK